ncbi:MAG: uracil-DNA glycosylase [Candidatus Nomurabacteria bacterium]|nr:uracil-DNA glycosylase [Candidatus Nomurabacteria bacterium]
MGNDVKIEESWKNVLRDFFDKKVWEDLTKFVRTEYQTKLIYPPAHDIFNAFDLTPFDHAKVIILGQDPYHGAGQAHGLCFSVQGGVTPPPSLKNIYKEIANDVNIHKDFADGNLEDWAKQGVFLLNAILSVRAGQPASHQKKGWEEFTDNVIRTLSDKREHLVFMLWGNYAKGKSDLIDHTKHLVLQAAHPSPFSAYNGFFDCKHFSKCNEYLESKGKIPIEW